MIPVFDYLEYPSGVLRCKCAIMPEEYDDDDCEPDFTLDDLEWEEAYPELCDEDDDDNSIIIIPKM